MTARMIMIDDGYAQKFEELIEQLDGHVQIKKDKNLELDPYFYERRESLNKLRDEISLGKVELIDEESFENEMDIFEKELIVKYENS